MDFVKLYTDMLDDHFAELTDEEVGIIIRAVLWYAATGEEPVFERRSVLGLTWRRFKSHIDSAAVKAETLTANAKKGGRPKTKENQTKPNETKENQGEPNETKQNYTHTHTHTHTQEQKQEQYSACAREETATAVIGIDGTDLSETIRRNELADDLIRAYNLNRDEPTRLALLNDLEFYGEKRMRETLERACQSNSRERVTVNFWRAILQGKGRDSPKGPNANIQTRTAEYQNNADYWKSLEVDLDAM